MLEWIEMPNNTPIKNMLLWYAIGKPFQYVLSYDSEYFSFAVSAKVYPNDGPRINLGEYLSMTDAKMAAETHYSLHRQ